MAWQASDPPLWANNPLALIQGDTQPSNLLSAQFQ